ncbi:MAG TPA: hypothetical protein VGH83_08470 [Candidatus Acidoferrum sp.]
MDKVCGGIEALRFSRRKDQQGVRIFALQGTESDKSEGLLGGDDAAGDDNWRASAARDFRLQPLRNRCWYGKVEVVFQIAAGSDAVGRRTEKADAFGIFLTLHQKQTGIGQGTLEKGTQKKSKRPKIFPVSSKGSIRYTPAHKDYRYFAVAGLSKKIWPDFCFKDDHQGRLNCVQRTSYTKNPIQRKINDGIRKSQSFESQRVPGDGSGGDNQGPFGMGFLQFTG